MSDLPSSSALAIAVLTSLARREGVASNEEIRDDVIAALAITTELASRPHDPSRGARTELDYRLAWARSRLKGRGEIEPDGRMRWKLTSKGHAASKTDQESGG